jgi:beta-phosphoglucomutase
MTFPSSIPAAAIFDMDGVLVDSNPFHLRKWVNLLDKHGIHYQPEDLPEQVLGRRNSSAFRFFFGSNLSDEDVRSRSEELEAEFRHTFEPHARPLAGLEALLDDLERARMPMAVASSAMAKNVEFVLKTLGFRRFFPLIVTGDDVARPKPDPEIYLLTARRLGLEPTTCVAFEDSFVGIESAKRAGMKCVGIASTFPLEELQTRTDLAVQSFEDLSLEKLRELFA